MKLNEIVKLNEIADLKTGILSTRIKSKTNLKNDEIKKYLFNEEYLDDSVIKPKSKLSLYKINDIVTTKEGDLIFSLLSGKATVINSNNSDLIVNQNYVIINPTTDNVDKEYLCYMINENESVRCQIERYNQNYSVKKFSLSLIKKIDIKLIELKKQRKIGSLYMKSTKRLRDSLILANDFYKYTMSILDKSI